MPSKMCIMFNETKNVEHRSPVLCSNMDAIYVVARTYFEFEHKISGFKQKQRHEINDPSGGCMTRCVWGR